MSFLDNLNRIMMAKKNESSQDGSKIGNPVENEDFDISQSVSKPEALDDDNLDPMSLFSGGGTAGNPEDASVFSSATRSEFQNIDYSKLMSKDSTEDTSNTSLTSALKEFFSLEKVQKQADKDGDGQVSAEEAKAYVEEIAAKDGNTDDLTMQDFANVANELGIEFNEQAEISISEAVPSEEQGASQTEENSQTTLRTENNPESAITSDYNYPTYDFPVSESAWNNIGYDYNQYNTDDNTATNNSSVSDEPKAKTLDELKEEKVQLQTELQEKQSNLKAVQNGENENVKNAIQKRDEAKNEYEGAIKNDEGAKAFKDDIIKNNAQLSENETKLNENAVAIDEKTNSIEEKTKEIEDNDVLISANEEAIQKNSDASSKQTSLLSDLKSKLTDLQSKLSSATDDTTKSSLNNQISAKRDEISKKEEMISKLNDNNKSLTDEKNTLAEKKKALEKEKENLENEKNELEKTKQNLEETKAKLEEQKADLDKKVEEHCTANTKAKLQAFNDARKNLETVKSTELEKANSEVSSVKTKISEIDSQIRAKIKEEKTLEYNRNINKLLPYSVDISDIPASDREKWGVTEETLPDGTKILACRWTKTKGLQPEWVEKQQYMAQAASELGLTILYSDGARTMAESAAGRAKKGKLVCAPGQSPHNYGTAFDIVLYKNGQQVSVNSSTQTQFARRVQELSGNTVTWGGDWRKKGERHHFELAQWRRYKNSANLVG